MGSNRDDLARYYPQVRRYLERHATTAYPTDDLVQDTFLRAYESVRDRGPPDAPLTWLKGVARHVAADRFRGRRAHEDRAYQLDADVADGWRHSGPLEAAIADEDRARITQAFDRLPSYDSRLLHDHYLLGLSCRALAEKHGIVEGSVKQALYRARKRLRNLLDDA